MRVSVLALGTIVLLSTPVVAESPPSSYTIEDLKVIAGSVHPTLAAVEAGIAQAEGVLRQSRVVPCNGISQECPRETSSGFDSRPRPAGLSVIFALDRAVALFRLVDEYNTSCYISGHDRSNSSTKPEKGGLDPGAPCGESGPDPGVPLAHGVWPATCP